MRVSNGEHEAGRWRIREVAADFTLEDAWDLPVSGGRQQFRTFVEALVQDDPARTLSMPARLLWQLRDVLGMLGLGRLAADPASSGARRTIPGTNETSLIERLPSDLTDTATGLVFRSLPFTPVFLTESEFVAELSNRTVHALMQVVWIEHGGGRCHARMGVYVKPRGRFGAIYMACIKPVRRWVVYPSLLRTMARKHGDLEVRGGLDDQR